MASKVHITDGAAHGVYDDRLAPLYHALGLPEIKRATDVEYDPASQEWVATHRDTKTVIASGPVRAEVIAREVSWLEDKI